MTILTLSCTKQQPTIVETPNKLTRGGRAIANVSIRLHGRLQAYTATHYDLFLGEEYTYLADVNNTHTLKFDKIGEFCGMATVNERSADVMDHICSDLTPEATESYYPYNEIQFSYCNGIDDDIWQLQYEEILRGRRAINGR